MKRLILILAAAGAAAFVFLRPAPPPAATAQPGWSGVTLRDAPRDASRAIAARSPDALAYVAGEVIRPGVYPVRADARVRDAVALAGGTRPGADLVAVNFAAHVRDGDAIIVPARGAPELLARGHRHARRSDGGVRHERSTRRGKHGKHRRVPRDGAPPVAEVDINSADAEALASIPGIGDGLAERIVEFRRQNGAFASVDELLDVAGITEHRLDAIIPYVVAR